MPNLAQVMKAEIARVAKRTLRKEFGSTRRAAVQYRRDIAELKRQVKNLIRQVEFLEAQEKRRVARPAAEAPAKDVRFSPRWVKAQRARLGLSAAELGRLMGVSALTVYNWEGGKARPRAEALAALAAVRGMGRREARKRLEILGD